MSDYSATVVSWNINGLGGDRFAEFINVLELNNFPKIVCLQETHSKNCNTIKRWGAGLPSYFCFFNHGDGSNRGTGILIHKSLPFKLLMEIQDWEEGRFTVLKGTLLNNLITIVSVYVPIPNNEKPWFFEKVLSCNLEGVKLIMGDFNSVPNPDLDRSRKASPVKSLLEFIEFTDTIDTWRTIFPNRVAYTYGETSRIDLVLLSSNFQENLTNATIGPKYFSDHSLITATITFGSNIFGNDFRKIRPTIIELQKYDAVFYSVWNRSLEYFRNELKEKLINGTFVGDPMEIVDSSSNGFNYTHELVLNNLTLGPNWWDMFKKEILDFSLEFQRKHLKRKFVFISYKEIFIDLGMVPTRKMMSRHSCFPYCET